MSAFGAKSRLSPYCFHTAHLSSARIGKFISILHQTTTVGKKGREFHMLFLISILHQTTTCSRRGAVLRRCFLFQFYIKPQHRYGNVSDRRGCFLFQFYIKPQPNFSQCLIHVSCFLFQFYIKPQPSDMRFVDCHSVMWPNERYERRMTGRGSRNDAGFVFQRYFSLKVECTSRARNRYMFAK